LGVHGQSKTPQAASGKPRDVQGHPKFAARREQLKASKNPQEQYLLKLIEDAIQLLRQGRTLGNSVQRDQWPQEYKDLEIPCLFKYNLDDNYRMTYSLVKVPDKPLFAWIIEVMTHKESEQRFGYD
jgi:hypothetical protein